MVLRIRGSAILSQAAKRYSYVNKEVGFLLIISSIAEETMNKRKKNDEIPAS